MYRDMVVQDEEQRNTMTRWAVLCVNAVHLSVAVEDWAYRHIS